MSPPGTSSSIKTSLSAVLAIPTSFPVMPTPYTPTCLARRPPHPEEWLRLEGNAGGAPTFGSGLTH